MPQHKLPKSLFKITLENVEALVKKSCINIEVRYGNYDLYCCKQAVNHLQRYLLSNIPGMVLDEVCEERRNNEEYSVHNKIRDVRIQLAMYMHSNMRVFKVGDARLIVDDAFWITHLCQLHNLVVLDLHLACTDEILEVVGNTCSKLEQINIVSRLEPERVLMKGDTFNALKLRFFISDKGLTYLSKCKLLKKITMNKMLRSHCGGRMMTECGIRSLIKSLPCVEFVSYDDMGRVLDKEMEDIDFLPLTYVSDHHPKARHIEAAARVCKNLRCLSLQLPYQGGRYVNAAEILNALAKSDLRLCSLDLAQFPCSEELFLLLKEKGHYLTNLVLNTFDPMYASTVRTIGQTCPSLKTLTLQEMLLGSGLPCEQSERQNSFCAEPIFCNLECLHLSGSHWSPDVILPLLLTHAKRLETLTLFRLSRNKCLDETIAHIISQNPLSELKHISILKGCWIPFTTIQYFFKQCPKLSYITFNPHSSIRNEDILELHEEIERNNFDLRLEVAGCHSGVSM